MRVSFFPARESGLVREMLEAERNGFVKKTRRLFEFKKGLETVAGGGTYFGPVRIAALLRNVVANPATTGADDPHGSRTRDLQLVAESHSTRKSRRSSASA